MNLRAFLPVFLQMNGVVPPLNSQLVPKRIRIKLLKIV